MDEIDQLLKEVLGYIVYATPVRVPQGGVGEQFCQSAELSRLLTPSALALPPHTHPQLEQAKQKAKGWHTLNLFAFNTIGRAFERANIRFAPIKGFGLAQTLYRQPLLRPYSDIDLLVEPHQATSAQIILHQLGYRAHPRALKPDWHHLPTLFHPQHNTAIELHTDVARRYNPHQWPVEAIWQRAQPAQLAGVGCWQLGLSDALVVTALHARHNLFCRLTYFTDAALLWEKMTEEEKELFGRSLAAAKAEVAFAHLQQIGRHWGLFATTLPLKHRPIGRYCAHAIAPWTTIPPQKRPVEGGALPKLWEVTLHDSWANRWGAMKRLIFPSAEFIQQAYKTPLARWQERTRIAWQQLSSRKKR